MLIAAQALISPQGDLTKEVVLGSKAKDTNFFILVEEWYVRAAKKYTQEPQRIAWAYYLAYTYIADRLAASYAAESANNTYSRSISPEQIEYFRQKALTAKAEAQSGSLGTTATRGSYSVPTFVEF